ncbi:MAG: hypothetical protein K2X47_19350, partial [Bdellovibrionales bacterium]|nr:hypothetical protein [Bdellovibrionales bacterium]
MKIPGQHLIALLAVTGLGLFAFQNCGGAKKTQGVEAPSAAPAPQEVLDEKVNQIRVQKVLTGNTSYCRYSDSTASRFAFENAGVLLQRTGGELPGPGLTYDVTLDPGCGLSITHKNLNQDGYQVRYEQQGGSVSEITMPDHLERT